jgi:hypothetical protein
VNRRLANIMISLKGPKVLLGNLSEIAFHEKAGRGQVNLVFFF